MNVSDFLALPIADNFTVLAGEKGLLNNITGVNILDNPEAMTWLSPGELIVTSGYFFKQDDQAIERFFKSFHDVNISALCIKPQMYLTPIPSELYTFSEQYDIPLIEIPYGLAFSKIMITVMNRLSDFSNNKTQLALDINSRFMEYGLKGNTFDEFGKQIERLLENPLIITNANWHLLTEKAPENFVPYIQSNKGALFFNIDTLKQLPYNVELLKHPVLLYFKDDTESMIFPIFFNDITYGYIIVLQTVRRFTQQDYIVLENVTPSIALKIVHQTENKRMTNRVERDFYRELLFGDKPLEELWEMNQSFDFNINYTTFIMEVDTREKTEIDPIKKKYNEELEVATILNAIDLYKRSFYQPLHFFKHGNYYVGLLGDKTIEQSPSNKKDDNKLFFQDLLQYMMSFLSEKSRISFFVGTNESIAEIQKSYDVAKQLMAFKIKKDLPIYYPDDYFFELFITKRVDELSAQLFVDHYLGLLIEADKKKDSQLLETLDSYLANNQNIASTSRELFIHRNTLLYRIEKIESLLSHSLSEKDYTLYLQLALYFSRHIRVKK